MNRIQQCQGEKKSYKKEKGKSVRPFWGYFIQPSIRVKVINRECLNYLMLISNIRAHVPQCSVPTMEPIRVYYCIVSNSIPGYYSKASRYTTSSYTDLAKMKCTFLNWVQNNLRRTNLCGENLEQHIFLITLPSPY